MYNLLTQRHQEQCPIHVYNKHLVNAPASIGCHTLTHPPVHLHGMCIGVISSRGTREKDYKERVRDTATATATATATDTDTDT